MFKQLPKTEATPDQRERYLPFAKHPDPMVHGASAAIERSVGKSTSISPLEPGAASKLDPAPSEEPPGAPLHGPATRFPAPRDGIKLSALRLTVILERAPMSNGTAVAHLSLPEPLSMPAPEPEIEATIGDVVANAAIIIAWTMEAYRCHGALDPACKKASAEALGALAMLQLDHLEIADFAAVALVEGRRVLNQRHGATLMRQLKLDAAGLDRMLDFFIAPAVEIAGKVTAGELRLRKAWAN